MLSHTSTFDVRSKAADWHSRPLRFLTTIDHLDSTFIVHLSCIRHSQYSSRCLFCGTRRPVCRQLSSDTQCDRPSLHHFGRELQARPRLGLSMSRTLSNIGAGLLRVSRIFSESCIPLHGYMPCWPSKRAPNMIRADGAPADS